MSAHTPGPWGYEVREYGIVITQNGGSIGTAYPEDMRGRSHDAEANARLIAAAPDLLDALLECLPTLEERESMYGVESVPLKRARGAIAKATGS